MYDSIYTERFMGTPAENLAGYQHSGVNNMTGFHNADFLLAAGSGDDNGQSLSCSTSDLPWPPSSH
jgi:dipeptidyl aminopeptidase